VTPTSNADLVEIAVRVPAATICLASTLARHGLNDEIPAAVDLALPRNHWPPAVTARVAWRRFAEDTFTVGRQDLAVADAVTIGLYSAERSIIRRLSHPRHHRVRAGHRSPEAMGAQPRTPHPQTWRSRHECGRLSGI
jgi:predicted transcriptional regulator of viral defense system